MFLNFDDSALIRWFGRIVILIALFLALNVFLIDITGGNEYYIVQKAFHYLCFGIIIYGIGKVISLFNQLIAEMKFFRNHHLEKKTKTAKVLMKNLGDNSDG